MKAVIPAAGLGVRFLPATKSQPKEMLPVADKPTIQYVVEEAVASGIDDITIVTGRGKRAIEDHFDRSVELEEYLRIHGRAEALAELERLCKLADIHYIRQKYPRGLGDAIYCARKHIGNEPFAVLLGDTITQAKVPVTRQMIDHHERLRSTIIAVEPVPESKIETYGLIAGKEITKGVYFVEDLVEKPKLKDAPSNLGITGTYVLMPGIFECIERTPAGRNGEVQLTDALRILSKKERMYGCTFEGRRFDIGNKLDWYKAFVELALGSDEGGPELLQFIRGLAQ